MKDALPLVAQQREEECLVESRALELRLRKVVGFNWLTVLAPALISAGAGAQIITGPANGWNSSWSIASGVVTLLGSMLVIVHKTLRCDEYQKEANRLRKEYNELATKYRTVHEIGGADVEQQMIALDAALAKLRGSADASVPDRYRKKALRRRKRLPAKRP